MSIFWSYNDIIFVTKLAVLAVLGLSSSWAVITISTFFPVQQLWYVKDYAGTTKHTIDSE